MVTMVPSFVELPNFLSIHGNTLGTRFIFNFFSISFNSIYDHRPTDAVAKMKIDYFYRKNAKFLQPIKNYPIMC